MDGCPAVIATIPLTGMDQVPGEWVIDYTLAVPPLKPKQTWIKTTHDVPVAELACGAHEIIATWDVKATLH